MSDSDKKIAINDYVSALNLVDMINAKVGEISATGMAYTTVSGDRELQVASFELARRFAEAGVIVANAAIEYQAQAARYTEGATYQHICDSLSLVVEAKSSFEAMIKLAGKALP